LSRPVSRLDRLANGSECEGSEILVAGYSGTPLSKKLGIKPGSKVHLVEAPPGHRKLLAPLPEGVEFVPHLTETTDLVHCFSTRKAELKKRLPTIRKKIRADAVVWVSWPKKAAHVVTDLTEDAVRGLALPLGLVDVKVCAIDNVWSGLKLVVRKELRLPALKR
jgi:hypothetical protein